MIFNFFKSFILLLFSALIALFYYKEFNHFESFSLNYLYYFLFVFIILGVLNVYFFSKKRKKIQIPIYIIISFFIINLLTLSIFFFRFNNADLSNGLILFSNIFVYCFIPTTIFFITTSFGKKIISKLDFLNHYSPSFEFILSLNLGFISFMSLVVLGSFLGLYNIWFILGILSIFLAFSYKEAKKLFISFFTFKLDFSLEKKDLFYFFSSQFFYLIACLVLGVGLISIIRPFPIGWDDLGVYMNYPKQLSEAGFMVSLGGMYIWQMFTGIGYMFGGAPVFAFFLNISGSFLSFIILNIIISDLLKKYFKTKEKTPILPLSIIFSTLFISLPMVVFQMSKDMKLDPGLFFVSISSIYLIFCYILEHKNISKSTSFKFLEKINIFSKNLKIGQEFILLFLIGIIVGFAFAIKFTSLILIVSILGLLFYFRLGILGFFSFLFVFLGIFTYGNLWKMMNVIVNPENIANFNTIYGLSFLGIGILLVILEILFGKKSNEKEFNSIILILKEVLVFLLGIFIVLIPWIGKNIYETYPNITIGGLVGGKSEHYQLDLEKIYTPEQISEIKEKYKKERKKENLVTTNEDLLRYIGYENGILNYTFLPWNLTMQKNQRGEFTDISFVFLALLPLIFIFLPYRNKYLFLVFIFIIYVMILIAPKEIKILDIKKLEGIPKKYHNLVFSRTNYIFEESILTDNIYDIDLFSYIEKGKFLDSIKKITPYKDEDEKNKEFIKNSIKIIKKAFYLEIRDKIIYTKKIKNSLNIVNRKDLSREELILIEKLSIEYKNQFKNKNLSNFENIKLLEKDFELLKNLTYIYRDYFVFSANDITSLKKQISEIDEKTKAKILALWNKNRNFKGKIIDSLSKINIPIGYIYIFIAFLFILLFTLFSLKKTEKNYLFKLNLVFATFYVFLWTISSFGIVWYGISMYFCFILMIIFSSYYFNYLSNKDSEVEKIFKISSSLTLLLIVGTYFIISVIPHSLNNLKSTGYILYKDKKINYPNIIFDYHRNYKEIFGILNISEEKRKDFIKNKVDKNVLESVKKYSDLKDISEVIVILKKFQMQFNEKNLTFKNRKIKNNIEKSLKNIYYGIINPEKKYRNSGKIYRIGTFLKYYTTDNYKRLIEDNLLFKFNDYIYSENTDETISRFKKLGIKYLVIDLNAATIDRSKTHDLTKRYEKILKTFTSNEIELISTNSICLKTGLEYYNRTKNMKEFMALGGVNYESYENGIQITRKDKSNICAKFIFDTIQNGGINENNFNFLQVFNLLSKEKIEKIYDYIDSNRGTYAVFKIK